MLTDEKEHTYRTHTQGGRNHRRNAHCTHTHTSDEQRVKEERRTRRTGFQSQARNQLMMCTGVPTYTRSYKSSASEIFMRMHPCEAQVPMVHG